MTVHPRASWCGGAARRILADRPGDIDFTEHPNLARYMPAVPAPASRRRQIGAFGRYTPGLPAHPGQEVIRNHRSRPLLPASIYLEGAIWNAFACTAAALPFYALHAWINYRNRSPQHRPSSSPPHPAHRYDGLRSEPLLLARTSLIPRELTT